MSQDNNNANRIPLVKPRSTSLKVGVLRRGRGFSYGEIGEARVSVHDVKSADLPIDRMRRSIHDFNVKALREQGFKTVKEGAAPKSRPKATIGKKQEGARKEKDKKKGGK
ncbi:MAG: hypothetical protein WED05_00910 [Candidatus Atabeyarchaeum deiterrae]